MARIRSYCRRLQRSPLSGSVPRAPPDPRRFFCSCGSAPFPAARLCSGHAQSNQVTAAPLPSALVDRGRNGARRRSPTAKMARNDASFTIAWKGVGRPHWLAGVAGFELPHGRIEAFRTTPDEPITTSDTARTLLLAPVRKPSGRGLVGTVGRPPPCAPKGGKGKRAFKTCASLIYRAV